MPQSEARMGIISLSRGADSLYRVTADMGDPYPSTATCAVVFTNTSGDVAATVTGSVVNTGARSCVQFVIPKAVADPIKAGFNFETFLYDGDMTYKLRYGKVIRREATYEYPPSKAAEAESLQYSDDFGNRKGQPGAMYAILNGGVTIVDNSQAGVSNALSLDIGALYATGAVRISRSINTDNPSFRVMVKSGGAGVTMIGVCANTNLSNYLALKLDANANKASLAVGNGPLSATSVTALVADTVHDQDVYLITYNNQTKTYRVYKNGSTTSLLTWTDTLGQVVHGQGYRYPMFNFNASLLSPGPQIVEWNYSDYAGAA